MHIINARKLNELIKAKGGVGIVAKESLVSESMLKKLKTRAYPSRPGRATRHLLLSYFAVPEEELFPKRKKKKQTEPAAS